MADRYFVGSGNYGDPARWSATDGGAGGQSVPTDADAVYFTANSGDCTINTIRVAGSVTCTGYTGTLTMSYALTIYGSLTLASGMTIAGSATLTITRASTLTSNGKTWPTPFIFVGNYTHTLADDWTFTASVTVGTGTSTVCTIDGNKIYASGGVVQGQSTTGYTEGTTVLRITGGTWSASTTTATGALRLPVVIAGDVTVTAGVRVVLATIQIESGTLTTVDGAMIDADAGGSPIRRVLRGSVIGGLLR